TSQFRRPRASRKGLRNRRNKPNAVARTVWGGHSGPLPWPLIVVSVIASRVENRRSNCSLPVVSRLGFRLVPAVRFGLVLFPVPAHRTGLAVFPHPALGKDSRFRPRKVRGPVW